MKKKLFSSLLVMSVIFSMVACSSKDDTPKDEVKHEVTISPQDLVTKMIEEQETPNLIDVDETMLKDTYKIDPTLLESYAIKKPAIAQAVYEVAVFKVKNADDVSVIKNAIEGYKENLMGPGGMYPSVAQAAEESIIINNGNYVAFLMVHPDQKDSLESLKEIFNNETK